MVVVFVLFVDNFFVYPIASTLSSVLGRVVLAVVFVVLLESQVGGVSAAKNRQWQAWSQQNLPNPWYNDRPLSRELHTMVTGSDGSLWLFGGYLDSAYSDDLFKLDVKAQQWIKIVAFGTRPSPRSEHSMVGVGDNIYVFGGRTNYDEEGRSSEYESTLNKSIE